MKCFNHGDRDSVGICRMCGKAVCRECAASSSFGITCKGECEKSATQMSGNMENVKRTQGLIKKLSGYYALVVGILMGALAFFIGGTGMLREIILIPAIGLIVWGIYLIRKNRK